MAANAIANATLENVEGANTIITSLDDNDTAIIDYISQGQEIAINAMVAELGPFAGGLVEQAIRCGSSTANQLTTALSIYRSSKEVEEAVKTIIISVINGTVSRLQKIVLPESSYASFLPRNIGAYAILIAAYPISIIIRSLIVHLSPKSTWNRFYGTDDNEEQRQAYPSLARSSVSAPAVSSVSSPKRPKDIVRKSS
jgi:peptidoglycan biosynthesis protein MviN/MurJ (putative lipid II flippase)